MVHATLVPLLVPLALGDFSKATIVIGSLFGLFLLYIAFKVMHEGANRGNFAGVMAILGAICCALVVWSVARGGLPKIDSVANTLASFLGI